MIIRNVNVSLDKILDKVVPVSNRKKNHDFIHSFVKGPRSGASIGRSYGFNISNA